MRFRGFLVFSICAVVLIVPSAVTAAGLVPCGGVGQEPCQSCDVTKLIKNVIDWLVLVLSIVATLLFATAGLKLVTAGTPDAMSAAKDTFKNVAIGYLILLASWLLVDTIMKALVQDQVYGMWNQIQCVAQPTVRIVHPEGYEGRSRGTAYDSGLASGALSPAQLQALAALGAPDDKVAAAAAQAGLDAEQTRNLQALMRVESGGCRNMSSPAGAVGCMQITPGTARQYDPALRGLSDSEVRERLMNNDYNITMGTQIYADLYRRYSGNTQSVFAAYNGGPGAVAPSRDCPGLMRYQCEWDNADRTIPNVGYRETRNYVQRIPQVAAQLQRR